MMKLQLLNSRKRSKLIQKHTSRKQFNRKKLRSKKKNEKKNPTIFTTRIASWKKNKITKTDRVYTE